jgi:integral membrane sensor domain MASE1
MQPKRRQNRSFCHGRLFFTGIVSSSRKDCAGRPKGVTMLAGVLVSAVIGGIAGFWLSLLHGPEVVQMMLSYQMGGIIGVLAFLALATKPLPSEFRRP